MYDLQTEDDEEEEPEYKKWLKEIPSPWPEAPPLEEPSSSPSHQRTRHQQQRLQPERVPSFDDRDMDDDMDNDGGVSGEPTPAVPKQAPPPAPVVTEKPKKLTFLTERAAVCEGQFRKKFEKTEGPKAYVPGEDVMVTAGLPVEEKAKEKPKTAGSSRKSQGKT